MAQFIGTQLTADGLILKAKGETNKLIEFTKIAVGDDVPDEGETVLSLTALKSQKLEVTISSFDVLGGGISKATGIISNNGLAVGFYVREIGLFAKDPDTLVEKLYAYTYVSSAPDWLPPEGGPTLIESEIGMIAVIGNATNITANIDDTVVIATKRDVAKILGIALDDGVSEIMQGTPYVFPITNYDGFSTYGVDAWIDTDPIASELNAVYYEDEAFHVNIPTSLTGSNFKMRLKKTTDGIDYFREVTIPLFSGGIVTPSITFPTNNSDDISTTPILQASAFVPVPAGSQTHSQTNWQVATDAAFSSPIINITSGTNLVQYPVLTDVLSLNTKYYARVRYEGSVSGWGAWSGVVAFTTMAALKKYVMLVEDGLGEVYGGCEDSNGNYYLCGVNNGKAAITKLNAKMEKVAGKTFNHSAGVGTISQAFFKIIYHNGYLYACGRTKGTTLHSAFAIVKFDTDLNIVAKATYEKPLASGTQSVSEFVNIAANGTDIYACGHCYAEGAVVYEALLAKFNESLVLQRKVAVQAANSGDKDILAGALLVEASKVTWLLPGLAGNPSPAVHYTIATTDRNLETLTYASSKTISGLTSTSYEASIVSDGTYYYISCTPHELYLSGRVSGYAIIAKLDSSYAIVSAKKYSLGDLDATFLNTRPAVRILLGENSDIIFGGYFAYKSTYENNPEIWSAALLGRVSKTDLSKLSGLVGFTSANEYYCKYNGFFINSLGSLLAYGVATTGPGAENMIAQSMPVNLSFSAYGPLPELPEIEIVSRYFEVATAPLLEATPTLSTSTTFTFTSITPTYVVADDASIEYSSEY